MKNLKTDILDIKNGDSIILACSGGVDSMVLLDLLLKKRDKVQFDITVVHINHQLREESNFEEIYLKNFCLEKNLRFISQKIELDESSGIEAKARQKRYQFFFEVANRYKANKILTAHHKNDQSETILLNLTRGSGVKGFTGISKTTQVNNIELYRPLIETNKREILKYSEEEKIPYFNDLSNTDNRFKRNIIRNTIFPIIEKEFPDIQNKLVQTSNLIRKENHFINNIVNYLAKRYIKTECDILDFDTNIFNNLDSLLEKENLNYLDRESKEFLISELIRYSLKEIGLLKDFSQKNINEIITFFKSKKAGSIDLPNDLKAIIASGKYLIGSKKLFRKQFGYYSFEINNVKNRVYYFVDEGISLSIKKGKRKDFKQSNIKEKRVLIPFKSISGNLIVRSIIEGDRIKLKGMKNSKRLSRFYIDKKVPVYLRKTIPIVTDTNSILWIPNYYLNPEINLENPEEEVLELLFSNFSNEVKRIE